MADTMNLSLPAEMASLPRMLAAVDQACTALGLQDETAYDLRLAVDELCTNLIEHGYRGLPPGPMSLRLRAEPGRVVLRLSDRGHACPPDQVPAPDLHATWDARHIGGLGWHLTRQVMDGIAYDTAPDGEHHLTLIKRLPAVPAPHPAFNSTSQGPSMKFDVSHEGSVCIVTVTGSIDGMTAQDLQDALGGLGNEHRNLVIDCTALSYTSSAGLRVLLGSVKHTRRLGGDLRLANVQAGVQKVLNMAGFDSILKIYPDARQAADSFAA